MPAEPNHTENSVWRAKRETFNGWSLKTAIIGLVGSVVGLAASLLLRGMIAMLDAGAAFIGVIAGSIGIYIILFIINYWRAPYLQRDEARRALQGLIQSQIRMEFDDACVTNNSFRIRLKGRALAKPWLVEIEPNEIPNVANALPIPLNCDQDQNHVPLQPGGVPRYIEFLQWHYQTRDGVKELLLTIEGTTQPYPFIFLADRYFRFRIQADDLEKSALPYSRWFELRKDGDVPHLTMLPESTPDTPNSQKPEASSTYP